MRQKINEMAYSEWRDNATDEHVQAQRRAFLDGFEAASKESEDFRLLRQWLCEQRDKAGQRYHETDEISDFVQRMVYVNVLGKLSEIGVRNEDLDDE